MCSDCTEGGWSESLDLCSDCWSLPCSRKEDNLQHVPAHTLVQLRQPFPRTGLSGLFEQAKSIVQTNQILWSHFICEMCKKDIVEAPYWCCIACYCEYNVWCGFPRYTNTDSAVYVCISCNLQIEAEKPWLIQRAPEPVGEHGVLHTLVLITKPLEPPQAELTVESGDNQVQEPASAIRDLRAQLTEHERVMSERLQKVEDLLERLLAGMARNGPN